MPPDTPQDVLAFWREAGPAAWFRKGDAFDKRFRERFLQAHEAAARGDLDDWARAPDGALALCILLDQFPRNAFRGSSRMFATDAKARAVADHALRSGFDTRADPQMRQFFIMPFMHSEDIADQERCVELAGSLETDNLRFARMHRDIIERFGRFPHRNAVLGRTSTPAEEDFLSNGGFSG